MSENTKATIEVLEHYHHTGGFYEIPVEIINTVEGELEEQDKEIERLNNIINELERKMLNDKLYIEDISKKQPYPIEEFGIRNPYTTGSYDTCVNYLGKIKELKGSGSNE